MLLAMLGGFGTTGFLHGQGANSMWDHPAIPVGGSLLRRLRITPGAPPNSTTRPSTLEILPAYQRLQRGPGGSQHQMDGWIGNPERLAGPQHHSVCMHTHPYTHKPHHTRTHITHQSTYTYIPPIYTLHTYIHAHTTPHTYTLHTYKTLNMPLAMTENPQGGEVPQR